MSDKEEPDDEDEAATRPKSRLPLILGLALFLVLGGGGFFATYSGVLSLAGVLGGGDEKPEHAAEEERPAVAFVPVGEMVIPLGPKATADVLVIESSIEVDPADAELTKSLMPRIRDVFNTYLRAIEETDIEQPGASVKLRAQLLRRIRVVVDPAKPRDLLFTTFLFR